MVFSSLLYDGIMRIIDKFLNSITMYRLTLYYVIGLVLVATILSILHILSYNPLDIIIDAGVATLVGFVANHLFAKLFHAVTNVESVFITTFIILLIFPIAFPRNILALIVVVILAMASKYLVTIEKRHVFNPAAAAVLSLSLVSDHSATWWVGTPSMLPFVLLGGFLLIRKIERERLVFTFLITYLVLVAGAAYFHLGTVQAVITSLQLTVFNSALFFFAFVMLTEPLTAPSTKKMQEYFAYIVAFLYATPQMRIISFALTPEMALCIGNVFSYIINPKYRFILPLVWKKQYGGNISVFGFKEVSDFTFTPGQYMEWTLPHKNTDNRGNRRYFSIASSPNEKEIMIIVKFYSPSSSYKNALFSLETSDKVVAAQLAGDFTLPIDPSVPLVFIAGGVGISPFRSMIQYLIDTKQQRNIILLYANRSPEEIAFAETFTSARDYGVKTIYILTDEMQIPPDWAYEKGHITEDMIRKNIPDFMARTFYTSGPQPMVQGVEETLAKIGVSSDKMRHDFFPGYNE